MNEFQHLLLTMLSDFVRYENTAVKIKRCYIIIVTSVIIAFENKLVVFYVNVTRMSKFSGSIVAFCKI